MANSEGVKNGSTAKGVAIGTGVTLATLTAGALALAKFKPGALGKVATRLPVAVGKLNGADASKLLGQFTKWASKQTGELGRHATNLRDLIAEKVHIPDALKSEALKQTGKQIKGHVTTAAAAALRRGGGNGSSAST